MISVILTAYNRKEFLGDALNSLNNQTIKDFEVILITNFDYDLGKFKMKIKHIISDGNIGKFLCIGISNSSGDIIVFMDDDDLFLNNKLESVNNLFKNNKISYFHNQPIFIKGNTKYKRKFKPPDFNMSCISIRKSVINNYIEYLKELNAAPDTFFYSISLCSGLTVVNKRVFLTMYRIHGNNSSDISNNEKWLIDDLKMAYYMINIFKCKKAHNYLKKIIFANKLKLYIFYNYNMEKPDSLSNFIIIMELWLYYLYDTKKIKFIATKFLKYFL